MKNYNILFDFFIKYENVLVGAYGGKLERILGIGGDGNVSEEKAKKKRRFPPVAIFVMNPSLKDVRLNIEANEVLESLSDNKKIVNFSKPGDEIAFFKLKTKPGVGKGRITITASSGDFRAVEEKYIDIVNTNPPTCKVTSLDIKSGWVRQPPFTNWLWRLLQGNIV